MKQFSFVKKPDISLCCRTSHHVCLKSFTHKNKICCKLFFFYFCSLNFAQWKGKCNTKVNIKNKTTFFRIHNNFNTSTHFFNLYFLMYIICLRSLNCWTDDLSYSLRKTKVLTFDYTLNSEHFHRYLISNAWLYECLSK